MLNQIYEIAKIVYTDSLRKNLIIASILIMLPLLIAAWLFETSNTGFQTGFILDAGSGLMSFLSIIVIAVLSFEQLFWAKEQQTPWFYFSRLKSRILFPIGKYLEIRPNTVFFPVMKCIHCIMLHVNHGWDHTD